MSNSTNEATRAFVSGPSAVYITDLTIFMFIKIYVLLMISMFVMVAAV